MCTAASVASIKWWQVGGSWAKYDGGKRLVGDYLDLVRALGGSSSSQSQALLDSRENTLNA